MKPRLNTRIITDVIALDLQYFSRKKLVVFFLFKICLLLLKTEIIISENSTSILKKEGHLHILSRGKKSKSEFQHLFEKIKTVQ